MSKDSEKFDLRAKSGIKALIKSMRTATRPRASDYAEGLTMLSWYAWTGGYLDCRGTFETEAGELPDSKEFIDWLAQSSALDDCLTEVAYYLSKSFVDYDAITITVKKFIGLSELLGRMSGLKYRGNRNV